MSAKPHVVKVQQRSTKGYPVYLITLPKRFAKELGIEKGDVLFAEITEYKGRKAIVYYKA
ncbi:MAG: AbrB/MazE/SpoVT family DNA-binding domain-containing protein [Desulfurococcaceae archaeon]